MNKIEHKDLDLLVKDCLMTIGIPEGHSAALMKNTGKTQNCPHKRIMPGSELFADMYSMTFKEIDDMPTLREQMQHIAESERLQWPVWLNGAKNHYMEVLENGQ